MKARVKFSKTGNLKFIGHLDVMRYFQKAFRRAEIDIEYSKGYSPHMLLSFAAPLGVGLTSDGEYLDMQLLSTLSEEEMVAKMNEAMVSDIRVVDFKLLPDTSKNSMSIVAGADYKISLKDGYAFEAVTDEDGHVLETSLTIENFKEHFEAFIAKEQIVILKKSKKSENEVDIKPFIYQVAFDAKTFSELGGAFCENSVSESYENDCVCYMQLATGSVNNLKPELVIQAFCQEENVVYNLFAYQVHRMEVYADLGTEEERKLVPLNDVR
ncbi:MAG TPA: Fe-S oxidoreductase [Lachnospiraceae bacterium]|uniref:TIGR03936 family radical SAM-associated protein n=1 Tax=Anaerosporobacter sp. TaxID=1872529 RepID=UPI000EC21DC1|nr:TIGR03936 family radical SAM-associated protein [Anaerosporobacter sp.]HAB61607.1 Fe-S oxidoreductase [Lachnospiraceae bacterium]